MPHQGVRLTLGTNRHCAILVSNEDAPLPKQPTDLAKDIRGDSATFENFMRKLVQVRHSEIKAELDAEKEMKERLKSSFSRVPRALSKRVN
jgi:hypothetical protein